MTNPTPQLPFHCFFRKFSFSSILRRCCNHHEKLPALHLTTQNAPLQRPLVPQHDAIQMDANPANAMTDRGPRTKFSSFISVGATKKPRHNVQHRNTNNKAVAVRQEAQCHGTTCNTTANTVAQCHRQHCHMKCNAAANAATARYKCWLMPWQCKKINQTTHAACTDATSATFKSWLSRSNCPCQHCTAAATCRWLWILALHCTVTN